LPTIGSVDERERALPAVHIGTPGRRQAGDVFSSHLDQLSLERSPLLAHFGLDDYRSHFGGVSCPRYQPAAPAGRVDAAGVSDFRARFDARSFLYSKTLCHRNRRPRPHFRSFDGRSFSSTMLDDWNHIPRRSGHATSIAVLSPHD
jgi:hypothetical protein